MQLFHKNGAFRLQGLHNVSVVDDLVTYVDRGPKLLECKLDDLDGPVHAGTKSAGRCNEDLEPGA